jgi:hypothetical protein
MQATVDAAKIAAQAPGWDESKLPKTSHVPSAARLKEAGVTGVSMMMDSTDVKGGQTTFFTLGKNVFSVLNLERGARARLQAKLPGANGGPQPPTKPTSPSYPAFSPPVEPTFKTSGDAFHDEIMGIGGSSSYTDEAGKNYTKVEKYLSKWAKNLGEGKPGGNYIRKAYNWAKTSSVSADPVLKAAGLHYKAALEKIGAPTGGAGWNFKPVGDVAEADRTIPVFSPSEEHKKKQEEAKKNVKAEHEKALASYKKQYDKSKGDIDTAHKKTLEAYEKKLATYNKKQKNSDKLAAKKLTDLPVPHGAVINSMKSSNVAGQGKDKPLDLGSTWDGDYVGWSTKPYSNQKPFKEQTYEIDLSDAVSALAAVGGAKTARLLVHYTPQSTSTESGDRTNVSRGGQVRIQFPAGASKKVMQASMKAVNAYLGIDARPASKQEQELTYLRKMAWLRQFEGQGIGHFQDQEDSKLGATANTAERIAFWHKKFATKPVKKGAHYQKKGLGFDVRYEPEWEGSVGHRQPKLDAKGKVIYKKNKDGTKKSNPNYQPEAQDIGAGVLQFKRFDIQDDDFKKIAGTGIAHSNTHDAGQASVANMMTLVANNMRANLGMGHVGTSATADMRNGGGNTIFTRQKGSHGATFVLDPRMAQFTGHYAHNSDKYGSKVSWRQGGGKTRDASLQERRLIEAFGSKGTSATEMMTPDRVDLLRWAIKVHAGSTAKAKAIIKALKAKGITTIGPDKKKLEEVIVA